MTGGKRKQYKTNRNNCDLFFLVHFIEEFNQELIGDDAGAGAGTGGAEGVVGDVWSGGVPLPTCAATDAHKCSMGVSDCVPGAVVCSNRLLKIVRLSDDARLSLDPAQTCSAHR